MDINEYQKFMYHERRNTPEKLKADQLRRKKDKLKFRYRDNYDNEINRTVERLELLLELKKESSISDS